MGRSTVYSIVDRQYNWHIVNDQTAHPAFDAYSFYELTPGQRDTYRYKVSNSRLGPLRSAHTVSQKSFGITSSADGTILLGGWTVAPRDTARAAAVNAWYLNSGGSVGMMRQRWEKPYNITNGDGTGGSIDGLPAASSFYVGVQADNTNDEIFTYGAGSYGRRASSGPMDLWERDDKPRRVLTGGGRDFAMGGWGRDTLAPGLDKSLQTFADTLTGLRRDYDRLTPDDWSRVLNTQTANSFTVPGRGRSLGTGHDKTIDSSAVSSKAYVGGSMQDIVIGGPKADVLIGDRIAGVEGGIGSLPTNIENKINELIGFPLQTTGLKGRDLTKINRTNILNDLYTVDFKMYKGEVPVTDKEYWERHNNWYPFGDFIAGLEGDDVIHGDDTEVDPARLITLKSLVDINSDTINDRFLVNDSLGDAQILKSDPLLKQRTWSGKNNTQVYSFGNDVLLGGDGNDRIFGGFGGDLIVGGRGVDFIDTGEAVLTPGYRPFYGADVVWGDLPGRLKGDNFEPDIFNIGPLYRTEDQMKEASPNPDAKTLQDMQAELKKATDAYNSTIGDFKTALKVAGTVSKAIPVVGPVFSALFKAGSLFLSKRKHQEFINDQSSPLPADGAVFIRDFDPLDIINIPLQEVFQDGRPIKATQVRINAESLPLGDRPFSDPAAFKSAAIGQQDFDSSRAIEIKLQSDADKPAVTRVVIERQQWLDDWARTDNPSASGDPITNTNINRFIGYGVKRTKIDRDSDPNNPANKLPEGQDLYNTVFTFAVPEALRQIALQNGQQPQDFWDVTSPLPPASASELL